MPYNNPAGLIAMSVVLELLAVGSVTLRFLSRRKNRTGYWADDWLILAALVFATGLCVMEIYGAAVEALGVPLNATIEDPRAVNGRLNKAKHIELSFLLLGIVTVALIKLSVVFLYRRIFVNKRWFRLISLIYIIIIVLWSASFVIAGLLECGSHLKTLFGTPQAYLERCGSAIPTGWGMVLSDTITDFITVIMPVPLIVKLHTTMRRKVAIVAIFAIGLFSVAASATKAAIYILASLNDYNEDAIILLTSLSVWNYVEVMVGICAACAVTFGPMLSDLNITSRVSSFTSSFRSLSSGRNVAEKAYNSDSNLSDSMSSTRKFESFGEVEAWPGKGAKVTQSTDVN